MTETTKYYLGYKGTLNLKKAGGVNLSPPPFDYFKIVFSREGVKPCVFLLLILS